MISRYLFSTTAEENVKAATAPVRFLLTEFLRGAAALALILTAYDALWPSAAPSLRTPGVRLYMVISIPLGIALTKVVAGRIRSRGKARRQVNRGTSGTR